MKHCFRIMIGMLLFAVPLCLNAQIKPTKPNNNEGDKPKTEKPEIRVEKVTTQEAKTETPAEPGKPKGGIEMPKISGFVQGMYQANLNDEGDLTSNTFRMRRVRLSVEGSLFKGLTYKVQGDFSRSPMLVDAFLKYKVCNEFAIQIGQFKTPFSLESPINPVNLEIFDYGEAIKGLVGYDDVCGVGGLGRDLGIMATGDIIRIKDKDYSIINYAVGVFNGNGPVSTTNKGIDNNNRKDIVGRLNIHPGLKNLTLSASYYYGQYYKDEDNNGTRNRWSAGAQYNDGKLVVRGEYLSGTTGYQSNLFDLNNVDLGTKESYRYSNGYYAVAGYNFKLGKEGKQTLMPVLRYEHFEPGDMSPLLGYTYTPVVYGSTNYYTVGLNYWPIKYVNFKIDYSLVQKVVDESTYSHRVVGILSFKF